MHEPLDIHERYELQTKIHQGIKNRTIKQGISQRYKINPTVQQEDYKKLRNLINAHIGYKHPDSNGLVERPQTPHPSERVTTP
jgi:hypothetical protein